MKIQVLELELKKIKERNNKVEVDKAWETNYMRNILLFFFTYVSLGLYMNAIGIYKPWLNALVPSIGFVLSTLTLPFFKQIWTKHFYKSRERD